ncbi:MAG: hypothetical protein OEQ30_11450 [Gammaproteobacteria bacterium]|jgi:hypothetical protein|nr:hypothetical protein [Gammaproteobacteria bacterium]MDH3759082.1 hypothetical protein [Gammaproteobacteria bacterium]MDH3849176.1 hypothetical protein [Gammaproteobacteria bacterium]MDH3863931.1 hypothetical protein [Gammaproteobacteria bacterium]MDH3905923.1 hypothetical protein [Gammaproteobacteria bacterium]
MGKVALDEFNVRLDLDRDRDSVIDDSILITCVTSGYRDWICP